MTDVLKACSRLARTVCGKTAEDDRMNLRGLRAMVSWCFGARARMDWWMVGVAVYQVGLPASSHSKNCSESKPCEQITLAPAATVDSNAPIRPWLSTSGRTFRQRSCGVSVSACRMLFPELHRFNWVSATTLGVSPDA